MQGSGQRRKDEKTPENAPGLRGARNGGLCDLCAPDLVGAGACLGNLPDDSPAAR